MIKSLFLLKNTQPLSDLMSPNFCHRYRKVTDEKGNHKSGLNGVWLMFLQNIHPAVQLGQRHCLFPEDYVASHTSISCVMRKRTVPCGLLSFKRVCAETQSDQKFGSFM